MELCNYGKGSCVEPVAKKKDDFEKVVLWECPRHKVKLGYREGEKNLACRNPGCGLLLTRAEEPEEAQRPMPEEKKKSPACHKVDIEADTESSGSESSTEQSDAP